MRKSIKGVMQGAERDFYLFLIAGIFLGIAQSVDGSTITNYLKEHFGMMILQRSALEFPREIPGLIVVLTIGALSFLGGDVRISVVANLLDVFSRADSASVRDDHLCHLHLQHGPAYFHAVERKHWDEFRPAR
jgi:hypothetical protein